MSTNKYSLLVLHLNGFLTTMLHIISPAFAMILCAYNVRGLLSETPKAISLNAIVDVRRRRHEMIFFEYLGNY